MSLPPASLPVSFALPPTLRSASQASPCLVAELNGIEIVRLLDPEQHEPWTSVGRLFAAAEITVLAGIDRYKLQRPAFSTDLAGLAPFVDIWLPLAESRRIAEDLGVLDELAGLLDWSSRRCWTIYDPEVDALLHNWQLPPNALSEASYSTAAMLATPFSAIVPRHRSQPPIRTLKLASPIAFAEHHFHSLWSELVDWSVAVRESWEDDDPNATAVNATDPHAWAVNMGLRRLIDPANSAQSVSVGSMNISRSDHPLKSNLAVVDTLAVVALHVRRLPLWQGEQATTSRARPAVVDKAIAATPPAAPKPRDHSSVEDLRRRLALLERALQDRLLVDTTSTRSSSAAPPPPGVTLHFSSFGLLGLALALWIAVPVVFLAASSREP